MFKSYNIVKMFKSYIEHVFLIIKSENFSKSFRVGFLVIKHAASNTIYEISMELLSLKEFKILRKG